MSTNVRLCPFAVAIISVAITACLPIPLPSGDTSETRLNIGDTVPAFIVVGKTTRADLLLALGEPDGASEHAERFVYSRVTKKGGLALVGAAPGGVAAGSAEKVLYRRLVITFNDEGIVASAHVEQASCEEWSVQSTGSSPCVDVRGRDVGTSDTFRTREATGGQPFSGVYWYPGVPGFQSLRHLRGIEQFQKHTSGSFVVGESSVYFFPEGADRETAPLLEIPYVELADVYVDTWGLFRNVVCIVLKRTDGQYESFGVWDPYAGNTGDANVIKNAGKLVESRWKTATAKHLGE